LRKSEGGERKFPSTLKKLGEVEEPLLRSKKLGVVEEPLLRSCK
jgi:hypothetical protein